MIESTQVYRVSGADLTSICNSIRTARATSDTFSIKKIPSKILEIGTTVITNEENNEDNNDDSLKLEEINSGTIYLVNKDDLVAIGDAIREKLGTSTTYSISAMPTIIASIPTTPTAATIVAASNV